MKKFTKRILATVLAACLLLCLGVPVVWAAEEKEASITTEYAFEPGKSGLANSKNMNTLTDYTMVNGGLWKFNSASGTGGKINASRYLYINFTSGATGWAAFSIKVPAAGTYTLQLDYEKSTNGANIGVYVLNDTVSTASEEIAKDTESAYYVGSYDEKIGTTGRNTAGNFKSITFSDKGEYVIAFDQQGKEASTRYSHIYGFTLTAELDSVDTAVTAAQNQFHSVKLLKNAQAQAALTLASGVTLDLNGKTLTADVRADLGTVTDTTNGEGAIVGASNVVNTGKNEVALMKDNVCRVFDYALTVDGTAEEKTVEEKKQVSFWFHVELNASAYTMLSEGATGLTVGANMQWTPAGGAAASKKVELAKTEVTKWAGLMSSGDYWFYVNVTGFESLTETGSLDVVPTINAVAGNAITYSVN